MKVLRLLLIPCVLVVGAGCDDDNPGSGGLDGGAGDGPALNDGGWPVDDSGVIVTGDGQVVITDDAGNQYVCYITTCAGKTLACGNCLDDDGDGLVDSHDPECLNPCDNTEGPELIAGIGGGGGATCKVDCYFDFGNGQGNDDCIWYHECDPLAPEDNLGCEYDPDLVGTPQKCPETQAATCTQVCLPYTPNGCDCFGCCTFPELADKGEGGGPAFVWIGAMDERKNGTCTFNDILDEEKCPRCTPITGDGACYNECGPCEVCIGRPLPPPECFQTPDGGTPVPDGGTPSDGGVIPPTEQCPDGKQPCGLPGQAECPENYYCLTGCCQKTIL